MGMTQIEWARAVAEHPEGHSRADVERACSVLAERLTEMERELEVEMGVDVDAGASTMRRAP